MHFQSFEMSNQGPQQRLGRSSFEEREEMNVDTMSIEDSKSIVQERVEANIDAGKMRV